MASSLLPGREYPFPPAVRTVQAPRTGEGKASVSGGRLVLPTSLWSHCGPCCHRWGRPATGGEPSASIVLGCHSRAFIHLCPARMRAQAIRTLATLPLTVTATPIFCWLCELPLRWSSVTINTPFGWGSETIPSDTVMVGLGHYSLSKPTEYGKPRANPNVNGEDGS